ncbi:S24 family peptidase [Alcaligenes endophyticus]|uniref:S24 family peptidase n=1 Tax=Alcaligenes endophyticus TaxID=1929088 RepID=A0ABT8EKB5_9BURK|nr:S24 family peptidase [Alcaligenes endophyticus]MCX5590901.1 S24 family peptidase [Alcaligenes endophyticus]MDN4121737.1 S24 family peptidase [Alcaligenes endophyticus]
MKPVEETRLERLKALIKKYESAAALNRAAGRNERDSTFSQLINGSLNSKTLKPKTMGSDLARQLEVSLCLPHGWMDTPSSFTSNLDDGVLAASASITAPDEDISVFELLDVKAACGEGVYNQDYPEVVRSMAMPIDVAQQLIGSANKNAAIKIIVAAKDSMVPTINPDDLLFVDTSVQEYLGESIYILLHGNELVCKRLSLVGKHLTVISDNTAYPSWPWDERPDATRIVGRVLRALPIAFKKFGLD